jgi:hypothetical protein
MGDQEAPRPIYSSRADDPGLTEAIDAFVVALAERIDHLQDAEVRGDFEQLGALAGRLGGDAEKMGFSYLASCSGQIEAASLDEDAEAARKSVIEATEIAQRIRLGHRGAA